MSPAEFKKLLDRYFNGECTEEEIQFIEKWYGNISSESSASSKNPEELEKKIWNKVKPVKPLFERRFYFRAAAAIAFLATAAAIFILSGKGDDEVQQPVAEVSIQEHGNNIVEAFNTTSAAKKVTLDDGSIVILEPKSSIKFSRVFSREERLVELSGEAFFNVKRDESRPFYVYSKEIVTKVLGTSFRISAFENSKKIVVAVKTGKVSVYQNPEKEEPGHPKLKDVILTPNQQLVYNRSEIILHKEIVPVPAVIAKDSSAYFSMQFDGMPVTEIFQVLEQNYGIDIEYDEETLANCVLTTKMTEEGFRERIDVICKAINATYSVNDAVIKIESKGCKLY